MAKPLLRFFPLLAIVLIALSYAAPSYAGTRTCSSRDSEKQCMICNCFFEAGGEDTKGKMAVNIVVIARANAADRPGAYCKVIYKPWQFSWTRDKSTLNTGTKAYRDCESSVTAAMTYFSSSTNPTHYYANKGKQAIPPPKWARVGPLVKGQQIGNHLFYNDPSQPIIKSPQWLNSFASYMKSWMPTRPVVTTSRGAKR